MKRNPPPVPARGQVVGVSGVLVELRGFEPRTF
jgi:hypothetical protein